MENFKGTKGEWGYSPQTESVVKDGKIIGCNQSQVWDGEGKSLAIIEPTLNEETATNNAKLIAAAPELLEFAMEMVKRYPNSPWIHEQAQKAIDKALK